MKCFTGDLESPFWLGSEERGLSWCVCVRVRACMFLSCWCSAVWWRGRGKDSNTCRWPSLKPVGSWPNTSQNPGVRLGRSYPLPLFVMCTLQQIDVSRTAKRHNSEDCFSKTNFILSSSRSLLPPEVSVSRSMVELLSMISVISSATYYAVSWVPIMQI